MADVTPPAAPVPKANEAWAAFQTALGRLIDESVRQELATMAPPAARSPGSTSPSVNLRKTIAETVSAILLETSILEKVLDRHLKAYFASHPTPATAGEDNTETIRQETGKVVREYLSRHLGVLFQTEIRGVIQKEMKTFLASDELKEMIDEKFRLINTYLKTEVIPKVVQQELSRTSS